MGKKKPRGADDLFSFLSAVETENKEGRGLDLDVLFGRQGSLVGGMTGDVGGKKGSLCLWMKKGVDLAKSE